MAVSRALAPEALPPVAFNIPQGFRTTLPNGLRVVIFDDDRLPLVSYRLAFMSGDAADPDEMTGVTSAMTSLITEGTESYSSKAFAEKIERLGASLSASSSDDFSIVSASTLSMYASDVIQMMAEAVFVPTFPEAELALYKRNTIENLKFQRSQPGFLAGEQTARHIYGRHPYSKVAPTPADVEKLTAKALDAARRRTFLPNNAVFIAVGDVRKDELMLEIEEHFGSWTPGDRHSHSYPEPPKRSERTITIVDRPGSSQANIVISNLAVPRDNPDYFSILVMNQVLGAGASSRVFMNLREEKGYTYGAYTRFDLKRTLGDFEATAEVRTSVTGDSLKEFFYELDRIRAEPVLQGELDDAVNFLSGVFPIRAETQEGLTNLILNQELYGLPHDYLDTYREHVAGITVDDVLRAAQKYVLPDEAAIVIVGDGREILPLADTFAANIEILDKDGHERPLKLYRVDSNEKPADVGGNWALALDFQGQEVAVELSLEQQGETVVGTLMTLLGEGMIEKGSVKGKQLSATAVTEIRGQAAELSIVGTVDGDSMAGTITTPLMPEPFSFSGSRSA